MNRPMIVEEKLEIVAAVLASPLVRHLRGLAISGVLATSSIAHAAAPPPTLHTITDLTLAAAPAGYQPPVIRSVGQDHDRQMLGDRSADQVAHAFSSQLKPTPGLPRLCAWPIVCSTPSPAPTGNLRLDAYAAEIEAASANWGVDSVLVRALIHAESAFDPNALSPKGAQGLMQLMPATAARFQVLDPFDPIQNINAGVQYLAWLITRFAGNTKLATAAYNAGEGAVDRYGGVPPYRETEQYVARVEDLTSRYRAALGLADSTALSSSPTLLATSTPFQ